MHILPGYRGTYIWGGTCMYFRSITADSKFQEKMKGTYLRGFTVLAWAMQLKFLNNPWTSNSLLFQLRKKIEELTPDQTKNTRSPPGIELRVLRNLVARSNHWATKPQRELRVNFRLSPNRRKVHTRSSRCGFVAQWLERATRIRKTLGSIPGWAALCFSSDPAVSLSISIKQQCLSFVRNLSAARVSRRCTPRSIDARATVRA